MYSVLPYMLSKVDTVLLRSALCSDDVWLWTTPSYFKTGTY